MQVNLVGSRDGGRELVIEVNSGSISTKAVLPRELLDDELGDAASEEIRRKWFEMHREEIGQAAMSKLSGGTIRVPFNRICLVE